MGKGESEQIGRASKTKKSRFKASYRQRQIMRIILFGLVVLATISSFEIIDIKNRLEKLEKPTFHLSQGAP